MTLPTYDRASRPLVSILLIAYNQEHLIADAVHGALAQTWEPLEIIISDDCSTDDTYAAIKAAVSGYHGPHRLVVRRNEKNEGISAHLSRLAGMATGELLFVSAGDDIAMPERCARVVEYWISHGRRHDLIATDLVDMDDNGFVHEQISHEELDHYRSFDDWVAKKPHLIGATHTWTRRLFERFGPMQAGCSSEDQIMVFRAIVSGGASNLHEPLVRYRRGGLSSKRQHRSVTEFLARQQHGNRSALAEVRQLQHDAETVGLGEKMRKALRTKLARERYIEAMFNAPNMYQRAVLTAQTHDVKTGLRIRIFLYTSFPIIYAPLFLIKEGLRRLNRTT